MKIRLFSIFFTILLLVTLILPISAGDPPALVIEQKALCEPGQEMTLTLSLSDIQIAGGYLILHYDHTLFSLTDISLLQQTDALTLTYAQDENSIYILLDAAQNVHIDGAFLSLSFSCSEETQPDIYSFNCTVPADTSFYALYEDGSTYPLYVTGCSADLTVNTPILPTCPAQYLACQETIAQNGNVRVRVCARVENGTSLLDNTYGFVCSITDQNGTRDLVLIGDEIVDQIDGGGYTYTASELGGSIYTTTLDIPDQDTVTIIISPFVRMDGQMLYGGSYTLIYQDGIYVQTLFS